MSFGVSSSKQPPSLAINPILSNNIEPWVVDQSLDQGSTHLIVSGQVTIGVQQTSTGVNQYSLSVCPHPTAEDGFDSPRPKEAVLKLNRCSTVNSNPAMLAGDHWSFSCNGTQNRAWLDPDLFISVMSSVPTMKEMREQFLETFGRDNGGKFTLVGGFTYELPVSTDTVTGESIMRIFPDTHLSMKFAWHITGDTFNVLQRSSSSGKGHPFTLQHANTRMETIRHSETGEIKSIMISPRPTQVVVGKNPWAFEVKDGQVMTQNASPCTVLKTKPGGPAQVLGDMYPSLTEQVSNLQGDQPGQYSMHRARVFKQGNHTLEEEELEDGSIHTKETGLNILWDFSRP